MAFPILTLNRAGRLAALAACALAGAASQAADGLQLPGADALWPQWQARISLQTGTVSPLAISGLVGGTAPPRGVQGAALLGDYYFGAASVGGFRASGGLLVGAQGGAPVARSPVSGAAGLRWGWNVSSGGLQLPPGLSDSPAASPYLGLGYSSAAWNSGLALIADVGLVSERPGAAWGAARALLGNSGNDSSLREMHLSPLLQLGLRYTF